jgi:hypothetical protein
MEKRGRPDRHQGNLNAAFRAMSQSPAMTTRRGNFDVQVFTTV